MKMGECSISDQIRMEHNAYRVHMAVFRKTIHPRMNVKLENRNVKGAVIINIPIITNMPRPPLNLRKQDQLWPAIDATAGRAINQELYSTPKITIPNQTGKDPLNMMSNIITGIAQRMPQLKVRLLAPIFRLPAWLRSTFNNVPTI